MPAGDAGLEQQMDAEAARGMYEALMRQYEYLQHVAPRSLVRLSAERVEEARRAVDQAEVARLRAQLAAQQAVIDVAREVNRLWLDRSGDAHPSWRGDVPPQLYRVRITLEHALAALDKAQAAQPEGEQA